MKVSGHFRHRGFVGGDLTLDTESGFIDGRVINTRAVITFSARAVDDLETAFVGSVEAYLLTCAEEGLSPEEPADGQLTLTIPAELHRALTLAAERRGSTLGDLVTELLAREAGELVP
jgi:predicted HicB family RNase H-like nuclease